MLAAVCPDDCGYRAVVVPLVLHFDGSFPTDDIGDTDEPLAQLTSDHGSLVDHFFRFFGGDMITNVFFLPTGKEEGHMFPKTYVISMDPERLQRTRQQMAPHSIEHVPGVEGGAHRADATRLSLFCRGMCTDRIIGCALAHQDVARKMVENEVEVALVLEDDVFLATDDLASELGALLADKSWEIITVFCQGICSNRTRLFQGSTAAYLMRASAARTMTHMKIGFHADFIRSSRAFETKVGPQLFGTYDERRGLIVGRQSVRFWLKQQAIRVFGYDLTIGHALGLLGALIAGLLFLRCVRMAVGLVVLLVVIEFFMSNETQHYRCSPETHFFGMLFPLLVLLRNDQSRVSRWTVTALAQAMLVFHIMHEFDK